MGLCAIIHLYQENASNNKKIHCPRRILSFLLYPQRQKTLAIIITLRNRNVRNEMELTGNVLPKT